MQEESKKGDKDTKSRFVWAPIDKLQLFLLFLFLWIIWWPWLQSSTTNLYSRLQSTYNECWRKCVFVAETMGFKIRLDLDSACAGFHHTDLGPFISFYAQIADVGEKGEEDTWNSHWLFEKLNENDVLLYEYTHKLPHIWVMVMIQIVNVARYFQGDDSLILQMSIFYRHYF